MLTERSFIPCYCRSTLLELTSRSISRQHNRPHRSLPLLCNSYLKSDKLNMGREAQSTINPGSVPSVAPSEAPETTPLRPLHVDEEKNILTSDNALVLQGISSNAMITSNKNGFLVLGMDSGADPSSVMDFSLGRLRCRRWLSCARCKMWWMTPEWGTTAGELPPETQVRIFYV